MAGFWKKAKVLLNTDVSKLGQKYRELKEEEKNQGVAILEEEAPIQEQAVSEKITEEVIAQEKIIIEEEKLEIIEEKATEVEEIFEEIAEEKIDIEEVIEEEELEVEEEVVEITKEEPIETKEEIPEIKEEIEEEVIVEEEIPQEIELKEDISIAEKEDIPEVEDLGEDLLIQYHHDVQEPVVEKPKKSFFERLKEGLKKTKDSIFGRISKMLNLYTKIDEELLEELEEILVQSDIGVNTTMNIIQTIEDKVAEEKIKEPAEIMKVLEEEITKILDKTYENKSQKLIRHDKKPYVIMVAGVNGVGKTTSIGKIANSLVKEGKNVLLAACDTFRAAAVDQLEIWAKRSGVGIVRRKEDGVDPASVAYDAFSAAKARGADVVIIDTAGRLHTKVNLMEELKKIRRVIKKIDDSAPHEVLLVLDATTGQNALQQAKIFHSAVELDGIVLTKLDGTAKGGIIVAIAEELNIPVKLVGIGEGIDDLKPFNSKDFVKALFE